MKFPSIQPTVDNELIQNIEKATDSHSASLDWTAAIKVCQQVTRSPQAAKTVRKTIQHQLKGDPETQVNALQLLKLISENSAGFHDQLSKDSFIMVLISIWQNQPTPKVRDALRECAHVWLLELGGYLPMHPLMPLCHAITGALQPVMQVQPVTVISRPPTSPQPRPRKQSILTKWRLKRQPSGSSLPEPASTPPPMTTIHHTSPSTPSPTNTPLRATPPIPSPGENIHLCIQESKTTCELLQRVMLTSHDASCSGDQLELAKELHQKCQDLHADVMRYVEGTNDPVYIGTLIDTNHLLVTTMDDYKIKLQGDQLTGLSAKALGKRPIQQQC
ncbi:hypothetical protein DM01DRAFT_1384902 [Hesseltinella vesiculosa]|uniref:VHS domain-containing protein n=1 Tax=Hesseltinella vesiculosa TaxID=101127 RepID=A0A1X2GBW5_9FUNG|nr:hypothetical protein DM01DRAFT_1384902 [Hesseltinella vesiculosa]